jgi:hypothetical protein
VQRSANRQDVSRAAERRKDARHTLILRAGVLDQAGRSFFCLVKNISVSGLELKFYTRPTLGAVASVRVGDEPPVAGTVAWITDDRAGVSFDHELDLPTLLRVRQKLKPNRRRAVPRINVSASASVRTGGRTCRAMVCDISSVGARIRTESALTVGDRAVVEFSNLPSITAYVRWNDGDESGLVFETPIPMQIIAQWIEGRPLVVG